MKLYWLFILSVLLLSCSQIGETAELSATPIVPPVVEAAATATTVVLPSVTPLPDVDEAGMETAVLPTATMTPIVVTETAVPELRGIAVLGASNSDEYRADDDRGGSYAETTLNWVEQLVQSRNLNFGEWGSWGEPRRSGYEFNWARSGATVAHIIRAGQHTGAAQQVAEGRVSHVIIFSGGNDFHPATGTYAEIYDGTLDDDGLEAKIAQIVADMGTIVDTITSAGEVEVIVVAFADPSLSPGVEADYPDALKRQRVEMTITEINKGFAEMAAHYDIYLADFTPFLRGIVAQIDDEGYLDFGGEKITLIEKGNEPHHAQLQDQSGHPGTVFSGLIANFFIDLLNQRYGLDILPLPEDEILQHAGLR